MLLNLHVHQFSTTEARDVVLIKSELLSYSDLFYIRIVYDTPSLHKHQVAYIMKPNCECSVILEVNLSLRHGNLDLKGKLSGQYLQALARNQTIHHLLLFLIIFPPFRVQKRGMASQIR